MSKRALIVGINTFQDQSLNLQGCLNDVEQVEHLLKTYYSFPGEGLCVLRDAQATRDGILDGLRWLLSGYAGDGSDVRVFHFSSHGSQAKDQGQDEPDGIDEALVPYDNDWEKPLRDDDLHEVFVQVPDNVQFTFIADCCFSGTIQRDENPPPFAPRERFAVPKPKFRRQIAELHQEREALIRAHQARHLAMAAVSLPDNPTSDEMVAFLGRARDEYVEQHYGVQRAERNILLAAAESTQTADDAWIEGQWRGAFSWAVCKAIQESNGDLTYAQLIRRAAESLSGYAQRPQLECPAHLRDVKVFAPLGP